MSVVELKSAERRYNESTVEFLEKMLEDARSGEIESILCVCFKPNGNFYPVFSAGKDVLLKVGALEAIQHDLLRDMNSA